MEVGTIYVKRPKYLFTGDIVDNMLKRIVEDLISVAKYQRRSWENVHERQVQKWVKKLRKFTEHDDELLEFVGPVSLEWMMFRATAEIKKEIEEHFDD